MQVTSMLSAGYLEPVQSISRVQNSQETDKEKLQKEQEILSEEQSLKAKLGNSAQVHTVYNYAMGSDGRRYIVGASVVMKGSEEDLSRVNGGVMTKDLSSVEEETAQNSQRVNKSETENREQDNKNDNAEDEQDAEVKELESIQREVIAHEAAHQAAAGELGGGVSYSYTEGPDGKEYITGGEVPIKLKEGRTPEETLRNMQQVQRAANAPADPSGQDRQVAARAAAIASKARAEIAKENNGEDDENDERIATVAKGTPVFEAENNNNKVDPEKDGVKSLLASVKELQIQTLMPAA